MRKLILNCLFFIFFINGVKTQEWKTILKSESYKYTPYRQFVVNPYRNQLWFVKDLNTSVIEPSGEIYLFDSQNLGQLWGGIFLEFAFTPTQIFYKNNYYGLFNFDNYISQLVYPTENLDYISFNKDTLYLLSSSFPYKKFNNGNILNSVYWFNKIVSKNNFLYGAFNHNSSLVKVTGANSNDFQSYSQIDNEYICPQFHDIKFSRLSDTLYVACKQGISFAYNYDFLDTITPNNTVNMPSANVLEMEFDHLDRLWAVFGDTNDIPFSIAMLENNTWINYFDINNSPIYFDAPFDNNYFLQMEIDTLGNIWVCDKNNLHTLLSPTTPTWVGLHENKKTSFEIYPNPSENKVSISFSSTNFSREIKLTDIEGKILYEFDCFEQIFELSLEKFNSGIYFVEVKDDDGISYQKICKK